MKILHTLCAGSALIFATGAVAQTTEPEADTQEPMTSQEMPADTMTGDPMTDDSMTDDAMPGDTMTGEADATTFTDAEVNSFAEAVLKIQALEGEAAGNQAEAAQIVADAGIDLETYTAIGTAMQTDTELAERVRVAAASMSQPEPAG